LPCRCYPRYCSQRALVIDTRSPKFRVSCLYTTHEESYQSSSRSLLICSAIRRNRQTYQYARATRIRTTVHKPKKLANRVVQLYLCCATFSHCLKKSTARMNLSKKTNFLSSLQVVWMKDKSDDDDDDDDDDAVVLQKEGFYKAINVDLAHTRRRCSIAAVYCQQPDWQRVSNASSRQ
jgi:hypothetical protein